MKNSSESVHIYKNIFYNTYVAVQFFYFLQNKMPGFNAKW